MTISMVFIVLTITGAGMVQVYMERLMGLDYVAVKTTYNLWFWILRAIFGVGFLVGVAIFVVDFFTLGQGAGDGALCRRAEGVEQNILAQKAKGTANQPPPFFICCQRGALLEIQWALWLLHGPARHAVRVDHRGPDVGMAEQFLDRADIVIGLQEMGGEENGGRCGQKLASGVWLDRPPHGSPSGRASHAGDTFAAHSLMGPLSALAPGKNHCQINSLAAAGYFFSS